MKYTLFILAVTGMSLIVTKSKLFQRPRIYLSSLHATIPNNKLIWFLNSIINCYMCFSVWAGFLLYFIKLYFPYQIYNGIILIFSATIITTIILDLRDWLKVH